MPSANSLLAMATAVATANAAIQGFNYGSTFADGTVKTETDFENEFTAAASLDGTSGAFTSARLYTMIQGGTTEDPISAIPAAIKTKTSLLLGLWASGDTFSNEIAALKSAITTYCGDFDDLVVGISVGSEDLYRNSVAGAGTGLGANPDVLVEYISQTRAAIKDTCLSAIPIGHVDTWDAWSNSSNSAVVTNLDWVGMDTYPYYQTTDDNTIENSANLFQEAWDVIAEVAGDREIWVTETGWPVSGDAEGDATASTTNARTYWKDVGCPLFGVTNTWWYILQDASADSTPNPSFGVVGSTLSTTPLYDLSCSGVDISNATIGYHTATSTASSSSSTSTKSSSSKSGSSSSSSSSGSKSSGSGSGAATPVTPAATPVSTPGSNSTATGFHTKSATSTSTASSGSGSSSGSSSSSSSSSSTTAATGSGSQLNSLGAAAVAVVIAAFAL